MNEQPKRHGCVVLVRKEGERVSLSIDGEPLGYIDIAEILGEKVRMAFCCDKRLRIMREEIK
jgi:sRNA-binding carbon storage regulator CsrA